jgi:hypothetical protein
MSALLLGSIALMTTGTAVPSATAACANEAARIGPSAGLPDCRAYELVTPPDTNGRRVGAIRTFRQPPTYELFPINPVSPSRDSVVYGVYSSPLLSPGEPTGIVDVYEAIRKPGGWDTIRRISPPGSEAQQAAPGGVSPEHAYAFTAVSGLSSLAQGGITAYLVNPDGTYELTGIGSLGTEPFARGRWISEGGGHVIFATGHDGDRQSPWCGFAGSKCKVLKLEPNAPPTGTGAVYDRSADGDTHVTSLLPGDVPPSAGEEAYYEGVSGDGSSVAFQIQGTLYVRVPDEEDGETLKVSQGAPAFAGLSTNGRYLFYVSGGNIHRFNTETKADEELNSTADARISNVSADGSHVYYISQSQIGGEGIADQPNLYVWRSGSTAFIATLAPSDLVRTSGDPAYAYSALGSWTSRVIDASQDESGPGAEASRTTPDGNVFVFESRAQVTDYDNNGHLEVYRYDDDEGSVVCVSCNPLLPPTADARLQEPVFTGLPTVIHNVTDDGSRVFFETREALVGRDEDGDVNDIYQWTELEGGSATVDLISSGRSVEYPLPSEAASQAPATPFPNILLAVTPDGEDVVFLAQEALVPGAGEGGTAAIYDARIGGGFAPPPTAPICTGESCRSSSEAPPILAAPSSETTTGSGNVKPRRDHRKRRCHGKNAGRKKHDKRCGRKRRGSHQQARSSATAEPFEGGMEPSSQATSTTVDATHGEEAVSFAAAGLYDDFGIESVGAEVLTPLAGAHPDLTTEITLNHYIDESTGRPRSNARTEEVAVSLPPGLIGNAQRLPKCKTGDFVAYGSCPLDSQVGVSTILATLLSAEMTMPVFNLEPPHPKTEIARFGFFVYGGYAVFIDVDVRTAGDYGVTATVRSSPGLTELLGASTTIWGNPADPSHDGQRMTTLEAIHCGNGTACEAPGGKRPPESLDPETTVFLTNSSACQSQTVGFAVKSYQLPGQIFTATAPLAATTGCTGLPFDPTFTAEPTSRAAGAPTGLKTTLRLPQVEDPEAKGTATMREARVSLPEGMQIAAGAADGLAACSEDQVAFHREVNAACPDASKLGTATIVSPALSDPLEGALYQRTPTPGHPFGLWLVTDDLGLHVKLPGEIKPDPDTGRLTAVFSDLPQVPVEEISFHIWGGPRAPLQNPAACGTYQTAYTFTPHSNDPAVSGQSQMKIDQGCDQGFSPTLHAGVTKPVAGKYSPLVVDLAQGGAEQPLRGFKLKLPDGELAKLKGVPLCPDAQATSGDCPQAARIGHLAAAAGPGPSPLWIPQPGKAPTAVYLAGPYDNAPFSIITVVPAQAGPFDLGNVVVRSGLELDPETAQAVVNADPLPQFFEGVGLTYRRLHVVVDRPKFALNPTDCSGMKVIAEAHSTLGAIATPSSRFQLDGCKRLGFKPSISLKLRGGTERSDYPALTATVKARKGDANIGKVSVALPHSEFLAQEHIATICTRKRFAVDNCPKGSVYGMATAWTPLLAKPLKGPVYLRSSDNPLPDLVMALDGELDVNLIGRIDSKNQGIRTNFDSVPDAPITKFILKMKGGEKSLLVNSTDTCHGSHRALVRMRAQNGRVLGLRPPLSNSDCHKKRSKKKK